MGNFKDLWVWKEGIELAANIYEITKQKPFSNDYGLRNQIQRAVLQKEMKETLIDNLLIFLK